VRRGDRSDLRLSPRKRPTAVRPAGEALTLTLSPLRGERASSCVDPLVAIDPSDASAAGPTAVRSKVLFSSARRIREGPGGLDPLSPCPDNATCTTPSITPTGLSFSNSNNTNYPMQVQFMADLVAAAVICGKARAVTMDLIDNGGGNSLTFPWLNISSPDFHAIAHKGSCDYVNKTKIDQWFYEAAVARVVNKLAAVPEDSGTVLDNTVVLVSNDMSEGSFHDVRNIPYTIIGSGGGVTGVGDSKYAGNLDGALTT